MYVLALDNKIHYCLCNRNLIYHNQSTAFYWNLILHISRNSNILTMNSVQDMDAYHFWLNHLFNTSRDVMHMFKYNSQNVSNQHWHAPNLEDRIIPNHVAIGKIVQNEYHHQQWFLIIIYWPQDMMKIGYM